MALKGPDEGAMKAFLRLSQGSFAAISALRAPCGRSRRRVTFWTARKSPKNRQGVGAIGRNGFAAPASMPPVPIPSGLRPSPLDKGSRPLDPVLRGPPMREAGNHRKGAGGHWIGFRSITAAAERPVTFGWCFSWLEARLLGWWGSSSAQGTCTLGSLSVPVGAAHWAARGPDFPHALAAS